MQGNPINSLSKLFIMTKLERGHVWEERFWTKIALLQQLWCLNLPNLWNLPTGSMWEGKDWTRFMLLQLQWQKQGLMNLKKCHVNVHEFWQRNKWKFSRQRTFECTHLIGNYGIELQWIWIISLQYVNNLSLQYVNNHAINGLGSIFVGQSFYWGNVCFEVRTRKME